MKHTAYCTICEPHSLWPGWISMTEHIKRDHLEEVICAWCKKILGTTAMKEPSATHGICDECAQKQWELAYGETPTFGVGRELVARS